MRHLARSALVNRGLLSLLMTAAAAGVVRPAEPRALVAVPDSLFVASDSVHAALRRILAIGGAGHPRRIALLGDSHSEEGSFAAELATRWSGGTPIAPAFVTPYSRGLSLVRITLSRGWQRSTWRAGAAAIEGPSGSAAVTTRATATMRLTLPDDLPGNSRLTIWWSGPPGASFRVRLGGVDRTVRRLRPPRSDAPLESTVILLPVGTREVILDRIQVPRRTPLRIGGFSIERPDATLELDLLGLSATTQRHPLTREAGSLRQFLGARQHDLVILWYGTNAVPEMPFNPDRFRRDLESLIALVRRATPKAAVLLIGPPDLTERDRAARPSTRRRRTNRRSRATPPPAILCPTPSDDSPIPSGATRPAGPLRRTHPNVATIRTLMREIALAQDAAFFDPFALQGEAGGMVRWYCATPRLAGPDLIHLSAAGYRHVAASLVDALASRRSP